jgi:hypothetical protein
MEEGLPKSLLILSIVIALFTILIIIIYCKGDSFKSYPCYFNIFFCLSITLDNLLRLIQIKREDKGNEVTVWCLIQALSLSLFDKIILNSITIYSIIHYLGFYKQEFYENNLKKIFITLVIINIFISCILTFIFSLLGIDSDGEVCYVNTDESLKKILDSIYTCILLFIDIICILSLLYGLIKLSKQYKESKDYRNSKSNLYICRFLFDLFLNIITFGYILILINKILKLDKEYKFLKDLIYIVLCLIMELFFTINSELFKEFMRLLTCNKVEKYRRGKPNGANLVGETEENEEDDSH